MFLCYNWRTCSFSWAGAEKRGFWKPIEDGFLVFTPCIHTWRFPHAEVISLILSAVLRHWSTAGQNYKERKIRYCKVSQDWIGIHLVAAMLQQQIPKWLFVIWSLLGSSKNLEMTLSLLTVIWKLFLRYRLVHLNVSWIWPEGTGDLVIHCLFRRRSARKPANEKLTVFFIWSFCRFRTRTVRPSLLTRMEHQWLRAVLLPTACSMVSTFCVCFTNFNFRLWCCPNPAESWYCKVTVVLPQEVLFDSGIVVNVRSASFTLQCDSVTGLGNWVLMKQETMVYTIDAAYFPAKTSGELKFYLPAAVCLERSSVLLTLVQTFRSVCLHSVLWMLEASMVLHELVWSCIWFPGGHNLPINTFRLKSRRQLLATKTSFQIGFLWEKGRQKHFYILLLPPIHPFLCVPPISFWQCSSYLQVAEPPTPVDLWSAAVVNSRSIWFSPVCTPGPLEIWATRWGSDLGQRSWLCSPCGSEVLATGTEFCRELGIIRI